MSRIGIQLQFLLYSVSAYLSPYNLDNILPIPAGMEEIESADACARS